MIITITGKWTLSNMLMQNLKKGIGYKISLNFTKGEISHYYEFILSSVHLQGNLWL